MKYILIFTLLISSAFPATYYLSSKNGSDKNSGLSAEQAWATIKKVNSFSFSSGDSVLFEKGNKWNETLTINKYQIHQGEIYFASFGKGRNPLIDGDNIRKHCIEIRNSSRIVIDGFELKNAADRGAAFIDRSSNITLNNCSIFTTSHGGVFIQNSSYCTVSNNLITTPDENYDAQTDGIYSQKNSHNIYEKNKIVIRNKNKIEHCDGIQSFRDTSVVYRFNYIEQDNDKENNAQGIYITTGAGKYIVYGNTIYCPNTKNSLIAFRNLSEGSGRIIIFNNTLISKNSYNLIYLSDTQNPVFKNNILYTDNEVCGFHIKNSKLKPQLFTNNLYYFPSSDYLVFYNGLKLDWEDWRRMGFDMKSKFDNPKFKNIKLKDFSLANNSPALGMGATEIPSIKDLQLNIKLVPPVNAGAYIK